MSAKSFVSVFAVPAIMLILVSCSSSPRLMSDDEVSAFRTISRVNTELIINSSGVRWENWYREEFDPTFISNELFERHDIEFVYRSADSVYTDATMSVNVQVTPVSMDVTDSLTFMMIDGRVGVSVSLLLETEGRTLFRWFEWQETRDHGASVIKPLSEEPLKMFADEIDALIRYAFTDAMMRLVYETYGVGEVASHACFEDENFYIAEVAHDWLFPSDFHTRTTVGRYPSWINSPVEIDRLTEMLLADVCPYERIWASAALWSQGDESAVEALIGALDDPNESVRLNSRDALRKITGQKLGVDQAAWREWREGS